VTGQLPRFLIQTTAALGDRIGLPHDEAKHVRVRRLRPGEEVALFDGAGASYLARIEAVSRGAVTVEVTAIRPLREHESPLDLTLAVALLRSDRTEWLIEKASELGVTRLQPFASTHALGRPSPARQARWQQIAAAAAKQCGRSVVAQITPPVDFAAVLRQPCSARLLLAERGGRDDLLRLELGAVTSVQLIIGPEGGFTDAELDAARAAGCRLVDLGPRILRAETAALAALALVQARWGDLRARRADRPSDVDRN
jgi:16S rRNA (uracil1498-N3)-methyltransferase